MTTFTAGIFGIDFTDDLSYINDSPVTTISETPTEIVSSVPGTNPDTGTPATFVFTITGVNLFSLKGTVTGFRINLTTQNGPLVFELADFKARVQSFIDETSGDFFVDLFFGGNDLLIGSDRDDLMAGFKMFAWP